MSILIKGLDMPEKCDDCIWIQRGYPDWCDLPMGKDIYNGRIRQEWCPLIEVKTPHGRLIDADEFFNALTMDDCVSLLEAMHVQSILLDATTIIPASEEG